MESGEPRKQKQTRRRRRVDASMSGFKKVCESARQTRSCEARGIAYRSRNIATPNLDGLFTPTTTTRPLIRPPLDYPDIVRFFYIKNLAR
uniref:Uncharacterized protein n=1 Tax=viral metagenome TaxID=1070528 RepID=A0A6C0I523_9ZZZZ